MPPLGLYIHLPWCERKCPYCDFNSHELVERPESTYVHTLLRDLDDDLSLAKDRIVDTVFIGGGTPSLFQVSAIDALLRGIKNRITLSADAEITLEANPGSAEADKFIGLKEAGINRLSIGVQSFADAQLDALGRVHDREQAHRAIALARQAGFNNFNLDLMHGLPGQSLQSATEDLKQAMSTGAPHISWYQLTIEPNTIFYKQTPQLPAEDSLASIQEAGEQLLDRESYAQYEVSAYSKEGFQCRHNRNYWTFGDYLGIGAGAHGKITSPDGRIVRRAKLRQPGDYMAAIDGALVSSTRVLNKSEVVGEFMLNALRLNEGFSLSLFTDRTGLDCTAVAPRLASLCERGLLSQKGAHVTVTELGRRFLDTVVAEFF